MKFYEHWWNIIIYKMNIFLSLQKEDIVFMWKWKDKFYSNIITVKYYSHILKVNQYVIIYLKFEFITWVTRNTLLSSKSVLYITHIIKSITTVWVGWFWKCVWTLLYLINWCTLISHLWNQQNSFNPQFIYIVLRNFFLHDYKLLTTNHKSIWHFTLNF